MIFHKHKWIFSQAQYAEISLNLAGLFQKSYNYIYTCEICGKEKTEPGIMKYSDKAYLTYHEAEDNV